ncbi:MAG: formylglycine-generating enzyme family protein [Marinosulfonomonas sp.]
MTLISPFRIVIWLWLALCVATGAAAQDDPAQIDKPADVQLEMFQDCAECPEMIVLPMGRFVMGARLKESEELYLAWNRAEPGSGPVGMEWEGPEHDVIIDTPIAMGRNEVTRAEFLACFAEGGCSHEPDPRIVALYGYRFADDPLSPVIDVSYQDMLEYVAWLNRKTGTSAYRLPTEAEWEYAARAGTRTRFAQGDTVTLEQANVAILLNPDGSEHVFRGIFGQKYSRDPRCHKMPVPVDMLDAGNAWGLRHMTGNVWEFTMSCMTERHLGLATSSAYLANALSSDSCPRVFKGGSFGIARIGARPAARAGGVKMDRRSDIGFRIVKEIK